MMYTRQPFKRITLETQLEGRLKKAWSQGIGGEEGQSRYERMGTVSKGRKDLSSSKVNGI